MRGWRGFTLIELLIAIVLVGALASSILVVASRLGVASEDARARLTRASGLARVFDALEVAAMSPEVSWRTGSGELSFRDEASGVSHRLAAADGVLEFSRGGSQSAAVEVPGVERVDTRVRETRGGRRLIVRVMFGSPARRGGVELIEPEFASTTPEEARADVAGVWDLAGEVESGSDVGSVDGSADSSADRQGDRAGGGSRS